MTSRTQRYHKAARGLWLFLRVSPFVGFIFLVAWLTSAQTATHARKSQLPDLRNTAPGTRYVGSKVCAGCHASIYAQYSRTDMGNSTFLPARLAEMGWLTRPVDIFNAKHNRHYQIFARDSKVYQSEYGLDHEGKEAFRHTEELAYVLGTGANGATPVVRRGDFLFEAPLSYYTAKKNWKLSPNYEVRDMGFGLPATADCVGCHTGRIQPVAGREGLYNDPPVVELAIGCENCHGPGEIHIRERLSGTTARTATDRSIVNPAKLPPWLADNICMNCHEGDIRALQPGKIESDFRPGTPLNDTVVIVKAPIDVGAEQSPLLEHYYSMTLSKCYRSSGGKLGCQSCHDPHIQLTEEQAPEYFRSKCLACHTEKSCAVDLQNRLAQRPADACSNCHMSKRPALTVSHSSLTDHRITRAADEPFPEVALKPSLSGTGFIHVNAIPGEPEKIAPAVLLRAYRKELIRGQLQFTDAYFSLLDRLSRSDSKDPFVLSAMAQKAGSDGNLPKAIRYATQAIELGGTSDSDYLLLDGFLARSGDIAACLPLLHKAISITPFSNTLYEALAARQLTAGKAEDSLATIEHGLELFPEDSVLRNARQESVANGLVQRGVAGLKQGSLQTAMDSFQSAVEANPGNAVAHDYIGVILAESGKLNEAIGEFELASRLDPALAEPHFHLGLANSRMEKTAEAINEYQEALRLDPKMPEAQYSLSAICAQRNDLDGAIILLRKVIQHEPAFAEAHYNLGLNLWNRYKSTPGLREKSDLDEGALELKRASELAPRQPRMWLAVGQILVDRGEFAPAVASLRRAVDLDSPNADSHYALGLGLKLNGDLDGAGAEFRSAIQLNPQHALAHRSLGLVLRERGDFSAAAVELRAAVAQLPDDPEGHQILGTVLLKLDDLSAAIGEFRRATSLDPYLAEAHASLAQALQRSGRKEEAQKEIGQLQKINSEKANTGRAMILIENAESAASKGDLANAIAQLREAVSLSPGFVEAHYQLGLALRKSRENAKAEEEFRTVLQLNPDRAAAHFQMALLLKAEGANVRALSELEEAVQLSPGLVEAHLELARLADESHDWTTAIREYQAALAWNPQDAGAHYSLSVALKEGGKPEEAERELQIAQKLDPALQTPR